MSFDRTAANAGDNSIKVPIPAVSTPSNKGMVNKSPRGKEQRIYKQEVITGTLREAAEHKEHKERTHRRNTTIIHLQHLQKKPPTQQEPKKSPLEQDSEKIEKAIRRSHKVSFVELARQGGHIKDSIADCIKRNRDDTDFIKKLFEMSETSIKINSDVRDVVLGALGSLINRAVLSMSPSEQSEEFEAIKKIFNIISNHKPDISQKFEESSMPLDKFKKEFFFEIFFIKAFNKAIENLDPNIEPDRAVLFLNQLFGSAITILDVFCINNQEGMRSLIKYYYQQNNHSALNLLIKLAIATDKKGSLEIEIENLKKDKNVSEYKNISEYYDKYIIQQKKANDEAVLHRRANSIRKLSLFTDITITPQPGSQLHILPPSEASISTPKSQSTKSVSAQLITPKASTVPSSPISNITSIGTQSLTQSGLAVKNLHIEVPKEDESNTTLNTTPSPPLNLHLVREITSSPTLEEEEKEDKYADEVINTTTGMNEDTAGIEETTSSFQETEIKGEFEFQPPLQITTPSAILSNTASKIAELGFRIEVIPPTPTSSSYTVPATTPSSVSPSVSPILTSKPISGPQISVKEKNKKELFAEKCLNEIVLNDEQLTLKKTGIFGSIYQRVPNTSEIGAMIETKFKELIKEGFKEGLNEAEVISFIVMALIKTLRVKYVNPNHPNTVEAARVVDYLLEKNIAEMNKDNPDKNRWMIMQLVNKGNCLDSYKDWEVLLNDYFSNKSENEINLLLSSLLGGDKSKLLNEFNTAQKANNKQRQEQIKEKQEDKAFVERAERKYKEQTVRNAIEAFAQGIVLRYGPPPPPSKDEVLTSSKVLLGIIQQLVVRFNKEREKNEYAIPNSTINVLINLFDDAQRELESTKNISRPIKAELEFPGTLRMQESELRERFLSNIEYAQEYLKKLLEIMDKESILRGLTKQADDTKPKTREISQFRQDFWTPPSGSSKLRLMDPNEEASLLEARKVIENQLRFIDILNDKIIEIKSLKNKLNVMKGGSNRYRDMAAAIKREYEAKCTYINALPKNSDEANLRAAAVKARNDALIKAENECFPDLMKKINSLELIFISILQWRNETLLTHEYLEKASDSSDVPESLVDMIKLHSKEVEKVSKVKEAIESSKQKQALIQKQIEDSEKQFGKITNELCEKATSLRNIFDPNQPPIQQYMHVGKVMDDARKHAKEESQKVNKETITKLRELLTDCEKLDKEYYKSKENLTSLREKQKELEINSKKNIYGLKFEIENQHFDIALRRFLKGEISEGQFFKNIVNQKNEKLDPGYSGKLTSVEKADAALLQALRDTPKYRYYHGNKQVITESSAPLQSLATRAQAKSVVSIKSKTNDSDERMRSTSLGATLGTKRFVVDITTTTKRASTLDDQIITWQKWQRQLEEEDERRARQADEGTVKYEDSLPSIQRSTHPQTLQTQSAAPSSTIMSSSSSMSGTASIASVVAKSSLPKLEKEPETTSASGPAITRGQFETNWRVKFQEVSIKIKGSELPTSKAVAHDIEQEIDIRRFMEQASEIGYSAIEAITLLASLINTAVEENLRGDRSVEDVSFLNDRIKFTDLNIYKVINHIFKSIIRNKENQFIEYAYILNKGRCVNSFQDFKDAISKYFSKLSLDEIEGILKREIRKEEKIKKGKKITKAIKKEPTYPTSFQIYKELLNQEKSKEISTKDKMELAVRALALGLAIDKPKLVSPIVQYGMRKEEFDPKKEKQVKANKKMEKLSKRKILSPNDQSKMSELEAIIKKDQPWLTLVRDLGNVTVDTSLFNQVKTLLSNPMKSKKRPIVDQL